MEEKKKIKVRLSAIITLILIAIIIGMGFYIYKLNKDKYYMNIGASKQIEELNDKIYNLEDKIKKDENKENVKLEEKETSEDENEEIDTSVVLDNSYFIDNGQITSIDINTRKFTSEELGISFEYPSDWDIKDSYGFIEITSPSPLVTISIKNEILNYSEILNYYKNDPWAMRIFEEGNIKVSNYDGYYFKSITGNGLDNYKDKTILIDLNGNKGLQISFGVSHDLYKLDSMDYSEKEKEEITKKQDKMYDEYEPIFDNIISTLKFEK